MKFTVRYHPFIEVQDDNGSVNDGTTSGVKSEGGNGPVQELGEKTPTNILALLMAVVV